MKARYIAIYRIRGANSLPGGAERLPLLSMEHPAFAATLTMNPEPDFLHVDKSVAIATQLLKGGFAPDKKGTLKERLAAEIEDMRAGRANVNVKGVSLVFECETETEIIRTEFNRRCDTDGFAFCFDAIDKQGVRDEFRPWTQAAIIALVFNLPANIDRRVEKLGDAVFLVDPRVISRSIPFLLRAATQPFP